MFFFGPKLHEKIVQDIGNVFGAVFNPKTGDTANYQAPDPNYSEPNVAPSPSAGYDAPESGYAPGTGAPLQGARVKKQINLGAGQSSFLKVPGKPPVSWDKTIRRHFLSFKVLCG